MKKTHKVLLAILFTAPVAINAQTNRDSGADKPKEIVVSKTSNTVSKPATVQIDENDQYQGRQEEFKRLFISETIPSDFPKYSKSYGIKGYNQMIDYYCMQHLNLLKEPVRKKLEGRP